MLKNRRKLIITLIITAIFSIFIGQTIVWAAQSSAEEKIANALQLKLEESKKYLTDPAELENVTYVDIEMGYSYNEKDGLKKIDVCKPVNGYVTFKDGTVLPVNAESEAVSSSTDTGNLDALTASYSEFRRVRSYTGYRKTEGYIALPSSANISGVDAQGEAAYNYLGVNGTINAEQGLCCGGTYGGVWKVYHNISGNWVNDNWPTNGMPAGTSVFMREYVPQDNQICLYVSFSGGSNTFLYTATGAKQDGTNQDMRRVTSLILKSSGYSNNNIWSNVYIATPSNMHLWVTSDTRTGAGYTEKTSNVSVTTTNKYYNETVNISCP